MCFKPLLFNPPEKKGDQPKFCRGATADFRKNQHFFSRDQNELKRINECNNFFSDSVVDFQDYRKSYMYLPCGKCSKCRVKRSMSWSIRAQHELRSNFDNGAFLTLTVAPHSINFFSNGSLDHRPFQLFMKRLRFRLGKKNLKFMMCGEYGPKLQRPHYHCMVFGHQFDDLKIHHYNIYNQPVYISKELFKSWDLGFSTVGEANLVSAGYIAQYTLKKDFGARNEDEFETQTVIKDGKCVKKRFMKGGLKPEYMLCSKGLGLDFFIENYEDFYKANRILALDGKSFPIPRYYDKKLQEIDPILFEKVKMDRLEYLKNKPFKTQFELDAEEKIHLANIKKFKRSMEIKDEIAC